MAESYRTASRRKRRLHRPNWNCSMAEGLEKLYYMIKATNTSKEEGHSAIPGKTKSCRESNGPRKKLSKVY